jgi:peptide/nickel transport system permease protein
MVLEARIRTLKEFWSLYRHNKLGMAGLTIITVFVTLAVLAPYITFHDPYETNPSKCFLPPNSNYWFGTDEVGHINIMVPNTHFLNQKMN